MKHLIALLCFVSIQSISTARGDVSTAEAARLVAKKSTIVLDVRTPEEYAEGHLRRSQLIDFYTKDFWKRVAALPKNATIVVYCRSGRRSKDTETKLTEMGYAHVYNMLGGFDAWKKEQRKYEK